ncbi:MAG: sugar phosphate isomerase (involved in capsule formation) protein [Rhodocyclales bacterium]|nr:sugar phosphate isomerase (involved in capsule formation) protein [Rhodocyclales bacterium]
MLELGKSVFEDQAAALRKIGANLGDEFACAVKLMHETKGRVIISGMGKSGIIGRKIAATLSSTGTSAFYVHPGEAYHGDLGMFQGTDTAVLISYSGETEEVIRLIPSLKHFGTPIIALVGKAGSTLANNADVVLDVGVEKEVCPNNLAPTTSTTATLVMGDALAVALMVKREFRPKDFAVFHPGGSLGRRLLTRVKDIMQREVPCVKPADTIADVIQSITSGGLGLTAVNSDVGALLGVITDGDLRRALLAKENIYRLCAADIMTASPKTVDEQEMFAVAEKCMIESNITALIVVNTTGRVTGAIKLFHMNRLNG